MKRLIKRNQKAQEKALKAAATAATEEKPTPGKRGAKKKLKGKK